MSQPNQVQQNTADKPKTVRIRMKPGCGRMLIGRTFVLSDGTKSERRPKSQDDILDTEDIWLEPGIVKEVPLSALSAFNIGADGKPSRVVEGYPMKKVSGAAETEDQHGNPIAPVEDTWRAGTIVRDQSNKLIASHPDCPFEIVSDTRAA